MYRSFFFNKDSSSQLKANQKWTPFSVFFKDFDIFRGATIRKRFFGKKIVSSQKHLWVAVSVFYVSCDLRTTNQAAFSKLLSVYLLHQEIWLEETYGPYYITFCRHGDFIIMWLCCKQFSHYLYFTRMLFDPSVTWQTKNFIFVY